MVKGTPSLPGRERCERIAFGERSVNAGMINRGRLDTLVTYGGANYHWKIYSSAKKLLPLLSQRTNMYFN